VQSPSASHSKSDRYVAPKNETGPRLRKHLLKEELIYGADHESSKWKKVSRSRCREAHRLPAAAVNRFGDPFLKAVDSLADLVVSRVIERAEPLSELNEFFVLTRREQALDVHGPLRGFRVREVRELKNAGQTLLLPIGIDLTHDAGQLHVKKSYLGLTKAGDSVVRLHELETLV
jgi:hypothetical protein